MGCVTEILVGYFKPQSFYAEDFVVFGGAMVDCWQICKYSSKCYRVAIQFCNSAPLSQNAVSAYQISCKLLSFYLERFLNKFADDQGSSVIKGSVYHIYIQPFTHSSGLTRNLNMFSEVSTTSTAELHNWIGPMWSYSTTSLNWSTRAGTQL